MFQRNLIHLKIKLHHYWNASIGVWLLLCLAEVAVQQPLKMGFVEAAGSQGGLYK